VALLSLIFPTAASALDFIGLDRGRGLQLYSNYCIACHDQDGSGSALARADISADMPVLLENREVTPRRYFDQIYFGGGGMPQMHDELSAADIWNIVYAIPLIRGRQHPEWAPEKFVLFRETEVNDGKH
jgi:mono/diheme cytochrome c family protein